MGWDRAGGEWEEEEEREEEGKLESWRLPRTTKSGRDRNRERRGLGWIHTLSVAGLDHHPGYLRSGHPVTNRVADSMRPRPRTGVLRSPSRGNVAARN